MKKPIRTLQEWYDADGHLEENNDIMDEKRNIIAPRMDPYSHITIKNNDKHRVYYKPEEGEIDKRKHFIEPGGELTFARIDGIATSKYQDKVFKVPDFGRVVVYPGGSVRPLNLVTTGVSARIAKI